MTPFEIITLVLAAAALLAAIVCVALLLGLKKNAGDNGVAEEFRRNREEQAANLRAFGRETNERMDRMQAAVNDSARKELESRAALSERIGKSLQEISDREQQNGERGKLNEHYRERAERVRHHKIKTVSYGLFGGTVEARAIGKQEQPPNDCDG